MHSLVIQLAGWSSSCCGCKPWLCKIILRAPKLSVNSLLFRCAG